MLLAQFAVSSAAGTAAAAGRVSRMSLVSPPMPPASPVSHTSSAPSPTIIRMPCTASVQATARMPPRVS